MQAQNERWRSTASAIFFCCINLRYLIAGRILPLNQTLAAIITPAAKPSIKELAFSEILFLNKNTHLAISILEEAGLRVELDIRNEKIGKKLREARNERVSYMCVIGEKEVEAGTVSVRSGKVGELGEMSVEDFMDKLLAEIAMKEM